MLVVKLEFHDANKGGAATELARVVIANVGTGDAVYGDYRVALGEAGRDPHAVLGAPQKTSQVHDHPRKQPAWALVAKALHSLGYARPRGRRDACE